ncbi:hypothetical protein ABH15_11220 [Methanoculleus taiwanensis]|uniref:Uncharacterized protein n=1 Tax=Methanoculleus taiwanensis TaxID=1550565 RepID=A0A498GYV1_9EURY|nr:hypothetical protein [Methanoculleus taiwanensis]RXE55327.1 hypothetical protein ABH15_11220 [Methanoculleus taiwanensis]
MNLIRTLITLGAVFYTAVMLVQVTTNESILTQAAAGIILLVAVAALTWQRESLALKRYEMTLLWVSVLCFAVYALAGAFGRGL